jgi:hypothetical protein
MGLIGRLVGSAKPATGIRNCFFLHGSIRFPARFPVIASSFPATLIALDRELVADLGGVGKIFDGERFLRDAPYAIKVYQEYKQGVPVLKQIDGSITIPFLENLRLLQKPLRLKLTDGQMISFYFINVSGAIESSTEMLDL